MTVHAALAHDEAAAGGIGVVEVQEAADMLPALGADVLVALLAELRALPVQQVLMDWNRAPRGTGCSPR